jgi:predicted mannosyl-3-phosphoglycerate phosphatase (HAD superfamily)
MTELVKVSGYGGLVKDLRNGGVINLDKKSYEQHKLSQKIAMKNIEEITSTKSTVQTLQSELDSLKEDIGLIKEMLFSLTQKGK